MRYEIDAVMKTDTCRAENNVEEGATLGRKLKEDFMRR